MGKYLIIFSVLTLTSIFPKGASAKTKDLATLTDKQAVELGMTELTEKTDSSLKKRKPIDEGYDLYDDDVNATLASVVVIVNESDRSDKNPEGQTAKVYHKGELVHTFNVSTGSRKTKVTTSGRKYIAVTPEGFWRPKKAYKDYYSYTFFGATMPYAIFFNGGIALHGTTTIDKLGERDSGGCVRFHPDDIEKISKLMRIYGDHSERIRKERLCLDGDPSQCITRTKYLDREKYLNVNRYTGYETDREIWTYDALIIVKKPSN